MKTLTKLIASTLIAIFTITILLTTPTYAATSVDVYCDGVNDQDKIQPVLADDTIINIHGDANGECVFTNNIKIQNYTGVVLQGGQDITALIQSIDSYSIAGLIMVTNSSVTINNISLVRDPSVPTEDEQEEGMWVYNSDLYLNNVTIDGSYIFKTGIVFNGPNNTLTATDLLMTNMKNNPDDPSISIILVNGGININWISGRSDAIVAFGMVGGSSDVTINGVVLGEEDFYIFDEGNVYITSAPINHLVNCGFPVGSQYDICPDTGGGTEEPDGGDNGNEIEAPGTGHLGGGMSAIIFGISTLLLIGCGASIIVRSRY